MQAGECAAETASCCGAPCPGAVWCFACKPRAADQDRLACTSYHRVVLTDFQRKRAVVVPSLTALDQPADGASSVNEAAGKRALLQGAPLYPALAAQRSLHCCAD